MAVVTSFLFAPFNFLPSRISFICRKSLLFYLLESTPIVFGFMSSIIYSILIKKYKLDLKKVVTFNLIPVLFTMSVSYWIIRT